MPSRPPPIELLTWAQSSLGLSADGVRPPLIPVAGDASNRRYYRALLAGASYILVDSPPATEKNEAFLAVRQLLAGAGVKVPALHAAELDRGYLLLQDLGDRLLLDELAADTVDEQYGDAMQVLLRIAALDTGGITMPAYDTELLSEELSRFPAWFLEALLGLVPDAGERVMLDALFDTLVASALEQPRVLVHRDFHSRNLMPQDDGSLGVIDFQDAVLGPVTYDLVSLLRDCYIQWSPEQVRRWALGYRHSLAPACLPAEVGEARFLRWFDLMGLQRHIKVLGTFARLYLRDGKPAYLDDLPLVIHYVRDIAGRYAGDEPVFAAFQQWFDTRLSPLIARQGWSAAP